MLDYRVGQLPVQIQGEPFSSPEISFAMEFSIVHWKGLVLCIALAYVYGPRKLSLDHGARCRLGYYQFQVIFLAAVFALRLWTEQYGAEKQNRMLRTQ